MSSAESPQVELYNEISIDEMVVSVNRTHSSRPHANPLVVQMMNLGFTEQHSEAALRHCNGVLADAVKLCTQQGELGMELVVQEQRGAVRPAQHQHTEKGLGTIPARRNHKSSVLSFLMLLAMTVALILIVVLVILLMSNA